jgi:cytosine/adenosine deaminase-related metal-dependent hydrolase
MAKEFLASHGIDLDQVMSELQDGSTPLSTSSKQPESIMKILKARLPRKPQDSFWDVSISNGQISSLDLHDESVPGRIGHLPGVLNAQGRLLAPSLCHAHIHLDKCFLLQDPEFSDLIPQEGSFDEAMRVTEVAKSRFTSVSLLSRGRQLLEESIASGVTAIRAFVEVDPTVGFKCLDAGSILKKEFSGRCHVQLCAFAQLPLFKSDGSGHTESPVWDMIQEAIQRDDVDVVGSTPYVEPDEKLSLRNVSMMTELAKFHSKLLDFHLDYFLNQEKTPIAPQLPDILTQHHWPTGTTDEKGIVLGHCTRLTLFTSLEWEDLRARIAEYPISFVGLPTSDLFMMRSDEHVRGTIDVLSMIEKHGFNAVLGVNNVGNAFTPQGNCDPLGVASLGVALYHGMTPKDAEILYVSCLIQFDPSHVNCQKSYNDRNVFLPERSQL